MEVAVKYGMLVAASEIDPGFMFPIEQYNGLMFSTRHDGTRMATFIVTSYDCEPRPMTLMFNGVSFDTARQRVLDALGEYVGEVECLK